MESFLNHFVYIHLVTCLPSITPFFYPPTSPKYSSLVLVLLSQEFAVGVSMLFSWRTLGYILLNNGRTRPVIESSLLLEIRACHIPHIIGNSYSYLIYTYCVYVFVFCFCVVAAALLRPSKTITTPKLIETKYAFNFNEWMNDN